MNKDNRKKIDPSGGSPRKSDKIYIFDTTLRDGEQSPGASMTMQEKIEIASMLDEMGVDVIEAGFPIASKGDFESVREVGRCLKTARVCALARASVKDIDRAGEAVKEAKAARIHTFISTSPVHMKHKLKMKPEEVLDAVKMSVAHARKWVDNVEWSPEDATRSERDFLCRTVEAAIEAGASVINIPDTVGYSMPEEYAALIAMLRNSVPNMDKAILSTHCHNDLGLAVANSLAGVVAGARQIECTINGIGERAGNAAMEEIVMAMKTRADLIPHHTGIKTEMIMGCSRLVSSATSFPVQYNKAIIGKNAFAHESGIHQDGMLKHHQTYEIMTPESVGISKSSLVMGKHSGRHAFREKIAELGFALPDEQIEESFARFKDLADKKKQIFDEDIIALIDMEFSASANDRIKFIALEVLAGSKAPQKATLEVSVDGENVKLSSGGDGPVDAIFNAIAKAFPHEARLQLYQVHAVTHGTDAQGEASVRLEEDGDIAIGRGADTDILVASAVAYISALNKLLVAREKTIASPQSARLS